MSSDVGSITVNATEGQNEYSAVFNTDPIGQYVLAALSNKLLSPQMWCLIFFSKVK